MISHEDLSEHEYRQCTAICEDFFDRLGKHRQHHPTASFMRQQSKSDSVLDGFPSTKRALGRRSTAGRLLSRAFMPHSDRSTSPRQLGLQYPARAGCDMPCSEPVATIIVGPNVRKSFDSGRDDVSPVPSTATKMPRKILSRGNQHLPIA